MPNTIIVKRSSVAGKVPLPTDLQVGELAVNLADQKIYSKNAAGSVVQLGGGTGGGGNVSGPASATDNALARFDGATGKLIQNSLGILDDNGNLDVTSAKADYFDLDTAAAAPASAVGREAWDDGAGTPIVGLKGGNVSYYYGQQEFARVYNGSGAAMTKGQVVYIVGAQGNRIDVRLARANVEATSANTIGFVAESIAAGAEGWVQTAGPLPQINTSTLTAGQTLYLSPTTAGAYTTTKPVAPNQLVILGFVERVNATVGSIYVKVNNGYELDELHDVLITSPASGNTLIYDVATAVWKNANLTAGTGIGVTNGAGSITIANTGVTSFNTRTGAVTLSKADINTTVSGADGNTVVIGDSASVLGFQSTAIGVLASAQNGSTVVGSNATAQAGSVAMGISSGAYASSSVAIGQQAVTANTGAGESGGVAIGVSSTAWGTNSVVLGYDLDANYQDQFVVRVRQNPTPVGTPFSLQYDPSLNEIFASSTGGGGGVTQIVAGSGVTISSTGPNGTGVVTINAGGSVGPTWIDSNIISSATAQANLPADFSASASSMGQIVFAFSNVQWASTPPGFSFMNSNGFGNVYESSQFNWNSLSNPISFGTSGSGLASVVAINATASSNQYVTPANSFSYPYSTYSSMPTLPYFYSSWMATSTTKKGYMVCSLSGNVTQSQITMPSGGTLKSVQYDSFNNVTLITAEYDNAAVDSIANSSLALYNIPSPMSSTIAFYYAYSF